MLAQAPRPPEPPPPAGEFRMRVDRIITVPDVGLDATVAALGRAQGDLPVSSAVIVERGGLTMASSSALSIRLAQRPVKSLDVATHGTEVILLLTGVTANDVLVGDVITRSSGQP